MVITALALLLGERADTGAIRAGSGRPSSRGTGRSTTRRRRGSRDAASRETGGDGRGAEASSSAARSRRRAAAVASSAGARAPIGVLNEIGRQLVVVHGQSDQLRLRSATAQREALDRFAGTECGVLLGDYQDAFRRWQDGAAELDVLVAERDRRAREAERTAARDRRDRGRRAAARRRRRTGGARRAARATSKTCGSRRPRRTSSSRPSSTPTAATRSAWWIPRAVGRTRRLPRLPRSRRSSRRSSAHPSRSPTSRRSSRATSGRLDADGAASWRPCRSAAPNSPPSPASTAATLDDAIDQLDTGSTRLMELDHDEDRIEELSRRGRGRLARRSTSSPPG